MQVSRMEWLVANSLDEPLQGQFTPKQVPDAGRTVLRMLNLDYNLKQVNDIANSWFEDLENHEKFEPAWQCMLDRGCKHNEEHDGLVIGSKNGAKNIHAMVDKLFGKQLGAVRLKALMGNADPYGHGFVTRAAFNTLIKATSPFGYLGEVIEEKQV